MDMFEEKDIYNDYPEPKKSSKKKIITITIVAVLVLAVVAGAAFFGGAMYAKEQSVESKMPMVQTIMDALEKYYVDEIDWDQLQLSIAAAVAGSIDPFTGLVEASPVGMQNYLTGFVFTYDSYYRYYITEVIPGSPAANARNVLSDGSYGNVKLAVGDEILAVNGKTVQHLNYSDTYQLVSGGDEVELYVARAGVNGDMPGLYTFRIKKEMLHIPVAYYLDADVTGMPSNVGYIKLREFSDTAPDDFYAAVNEFLSDPDKPNKLVLDLRGNGGGSVAMCGFIASYFVKQNGTSDGVKMARYVYNSGYGNMQETYFYTDTQYVSDLDGTTYTSVNLYDEVPGFECVILVNGGSASSSELLTAALSHYCGVKAIGEKTYGKGVAQIAISYNNQRYELYITNGRYYIPTYKDGETVFENSIHGVGITPDIAADASGIYSVTEDPCFIAAVEALNGGSAPALSA